MLVGCAAGDKDGWFVLPVAPDETVRCVRALNVLRDYHPFDSQRALVVLARQLHPGGLLVEGSASTCGAVCVAVLVRRLDSAAAAGAADAKAEMTVEVEVEAGGGGGAPHSAAGGNTSMMGEMDKLGTIIEGILFCVELPGGSVCRQGTQKLKGMPTQWFKRFIPQAWLHGRQKVGPAGRQQQAAGIRVAFVARVGKEA